MKSFAAGIKRFLQEEEGVTMVEYGLIAALIAIVCIVVLTLIGTNLQLVFQRIADCLQGAVNGVNPPC